MAGILLTGFEAFGGFRENPSWEAVRLLPGRVAGRRVHRLCLPVVYGEAGRRLEEAVAALRPEAVICVGAAAGRFAVTPELAALNWRMSASPDNAGVRFDGCRIELDGPDTLMTRLPVTAMAAAIRAAGIPAEVSLSAGAYVCNDLYWHLLRHRAAWGVRGLFVHVPPAERIAPARSAEALACCAAMIPGEETGL